MATKISVFDSIEVGYRPTRELTAEEKEVMSKNEEERLSHLQIIGECVSCGYPEAFATVDEMNDVPCKECGGDFEIIDMKELEKTLECLHDQKGVSNAEDIESRQ